MKSIEQLRQFVLEALWAPKLTSVPGKNSLVRVRGTWVPDYDANMPETFDRVYHRADFDEVLKVVDENGSMEYSTPSEAIYHILVEEYREVK